MDGREKKNPSNLKFIIIIILNEQRQVFLQQVFVLESRSQEVN